MSELKKEIQDILHPEKTELHPPPPPSIREKSLLSSVSAETGNNLNEHDSLNWRDRDSKPMLEMGEIDFSAIANSSEFKRFVYFIYTGKVHRGTLKQLDREIKQTQEAVEVIKELGRGSKADYREVMKELKERLKEVKDESSTN